MAYLCTLEEKVQCLFVNLVIFEMHRTRAPGAPLLTVIKTLFRDNLQVVLDGYILFKITKPFNLNSWRQRLLQRHYFSLFVSLEEPEW